MEAVVKLMQTMAKGCIIDVTINDLTVKTVDKPDDIAVSVEYKGQWWGKAVSKEQQHNSVESAVWGTINAQVLKFKQDEEEQDA